MAVTAEGERVWQAELRRAARWEAANFALPPGWEDGREPVDALTVDSATTRDRDDGIAMNLLPGPDGGYLPVIGIADVGTFLTADDMPATEALARQRGETNYMARGTRPMIDRRISEGKLSLLDDREDLETPVLAVTLEVAADGTVGGVTLSRMRLRPTAFTYDQIAALKSGTADDQRLVAGYEDFAKLLYARRKAPDGAADFKADELAGEPGGDRPGELIVQEFMILANTAVAKFMQANNIPGLFRNHLGEYAYYSPIPEGHASLGLTEPYCHFTSPLRRFADFVNHANICAFLDGREFPYPPEVLEGIAVNLNNIQQQARERRQQHQRVLGGQAVVAAATPALQAA